MGGIPTPAATGRKEFDGSAVLCGRRVPWSGFMWLPRVFSFMHSELQWSHLHGANVPTLVGFPVRNVAGRAAQLPTITKSIRLVYEGLIGYPASYPTAAAPL